MKIKEEKEIKTSDNWIFKPGIYKSNEDKYYNDLWIVTDHVAYSYDRVVIYEELIPEIIKDYLLQYDEHNKKPKPIYYEDDTNYADYDEEDEDIIVSSIHVLYLQPQRDKHEDIEDVKWKVFYNFDKPLKIYRDKYYTTMPNGDKHRGISIKYKNANEIEPDDEGFENIPKTLVNTLLSITNNIDDLHDCLQCKSIGYINDNNSHGPVKTICNKCHGLKQIPFINNII